MSDQLHPQTGAADLNPEQFNMPPEYFVRMQLDLMDQNPDVGILKGSILSDVGQTTEVDELNVVLGNAIDKTRVNGDIFEKSVNQLPERDITDVDAEKRSTEAWTRAFYDIDPEQIDAETGRMLFYYPEQQRKFTKSQIAAFALNELSSDPDNIADRRKAVLSRAKKSNN